MDQRVIIELNEGFERNPEAPAIVEQRAVVIGNSPRPGVDIQTAFEVAGLREAAEFGEAVAAAQGPVAAAWPIVEFQDLELVAGVAQLTRRRHAGYFDPQDENVSPLCITLTLH